MDEETILKLKENYKKLFDQQLIEMFSYGKEAYEETAWYLIVKEAMSRNLQLPFIAEGFKETKESKSPTLKTVVLMPIIYLFGSFAIGYTIGFWNFANYILLNKAKSSGIIDCCLLVFYLFLIVFLVKRYSGYFFSGSWKINTYSNLETGLKWSIPFIFIIGHGVSTPEIRSEWLKFYLMENNLSKEDITAITAILISAVLLVASFLEELIFRGLIQQYIKKFVTPGVSVLITAGIFTLAHFGNFFFIPFSLGDVGLWFIGGIFTGFAFNMSNSCISSFIPHLVYNIKFIVIVPLMLAF